MLPDEARLLRGRRSEGSVVFLRRVRGRESWTAPVTHKPSTFSHYNGGKRNGDPIWLKITFL